jgi:hypothetical protein
VARKETMSTAFWTAIGQQLTELRTAATADDVLRILSHDRNPYRLEDPNWDGADGGAKGFFGGSGGNESVADALEEAGWTYLWSRANYWWAMRSPDGESVITYCEGDIYPEDRRH